MSTRTPHRRSLAGLVLTAAIIELTLTTAYIHYSLGGLLFTLNAAGYAALALILALTSAYPVGLVGRFCWLPRVGLGGYTLLTIGAYLVMGPFFSLGWIAKAVEVAILTLLTADAIRQYGSLAGFARAALASVPGPRPPQPARP
jgi:hypothetical protein